jgi:hypothetical protein
MEMTQATALKVGGSVGGMKSFGEWRIVLREQYYMTVVDRAPVGADPHEEAAIRRRVFAIWHHSSMQ